MKLHGIPIGKIFFQGAPRLLEANVSVFPCRELKGADRVVIEAYLALVARRFCGSAPYKNDAPKKQTKEQGEARRAIVEGIGGDIEDEFGFRLTLGKEHAEEMVRDRSGDTLDAVLCAVQSGWAYSMRKSKSKGYGIPTADYPVIQSEGWIVDPITVQGAQRQSS
jgi:hypothetical protein